MLKNNLFNYCQKQLNKNYSNLDYILKATRSRENEHAAAGRQRQVKQFIFLRARMYLLYILTTVGLAHAALSGEQVLGFHVADVSVRLARLAQPDHGPLSDLGHLLRLGLHAGIPQPALVPGPRHAPVRGSGAGHHLAALVRLHLAGAALPGRRFPGHGPRPVVCVIESVKI